MRRFVLLALVGAALLVGFFWGGELGVGPMIVTKEHEQKVVLFFGQPTKTIVEPGVTWWHWWPLERVRTFPRRLQYLNAEPVEMLIRRGEKIIIDYYVVWQITDPLDFMERFPLGVASAEARIQEIVNASVGAKIGNLSLSELLARSEILEVLARESTEDLDGGGAAIVDVRLNRVEIPRNAEKAAYEQMAEQRRARAREQRVAGERRAREIRAEAEKEAADLVAQAQADAELTRGEGDAEAARIHAEAYNKDREFYAFWRSLEAYRKTIGEGTTLVLPPDHEFFRYLSPENVEGR
ncbi:MAG: protease modulator HflC [Proteobacteria bacterium]|nr:protease modulator HflC [Pseudomonadota bacterium]